MLQSMSQVGFLQPKCTKLQPKNGQIFNNTAFRASCSKESKDLFYMYTVCHNYRNPKLL